MSINEQGLSAEKKQYFSSSQGPFNNDHNILMFFGGAGRGQIVETIIRALRIGDPLITVCGERGSGKTMLSLVLADRLKRRYNNIRYDLPQLSAALMLRHMLIEICPQHANLLTAGNAAEGVSDGLLHLCTQHLLEALKTRRVGSKPYALTVDSRMALDKQTLQLLNDLVDAQELDDPSLQVVLFRRVDADSEVAGVNDHTTVRTADNHFWLRRLTLNEIGDYLRHYMTLFDYNQRDVFTREMVYFIADRAEGVFRAINTLARNGFMVASLEDADRVSMGHLLTAGLPTREEPPIKRSFIQQHRAGLVGILGLSVFAGLACIAILQPF